ncbi:TPA: O-antigen ligase family protein [Aeromonas veronii]
MSYASLITIIFSLLMVVTQYIGISHAPENLKIDKTSNYLSAMIFILSILYSISYYEFFKRMTQTHRYLIYRMCGYIFIFYLSLELFIRITIGNPSLGLLYGFKKSFFYFDSNFTGLVIMSFLMFFLYMKNIGMEKTKLIIFLLMILLILTVSRAAILATIIGLFVFINHKSFRIKAFISLIVYLVVFFAMCILYLFDDVNFLNIDGSFNSKFYIVSKAMELYEQLPHFSIMFGLGLGNFDKFTEIFAHNIFVTMFMEMGVVGTLLLLLFIALSIRISRGAASYIWLPTFVCGVSLFGVYSPYLFLINAAILLESKNDSGVS